MSRESQPRYDASRNQWILRYHNQRHYLCSGKGRYVQAMRRATEIMGGVRTGDAQTVAELIEAWMASYGNDWYHAQLASWYAYAGTLGLDALQDDHLRGYLVWLKRARYIPRAYREGLSDDVLVTSGTPSCKYPRAKRYSTRAVRAKINAAWRVISWAHRQRRAGGQSRLLEYLPEKPGLPKGDAEPRDYPLEFLRTLFATPSELLAKYPKGAPFRALGSRSRAILLWILETGCRPGEACTLKWSDVKVWTAEKREHKTRDSAGGRRRIPMTDVARLILEHRPRESEYVFVNRRGRPYKPGGLRSIVRRRAEAVGLDVRTVYGLRHSRAQSILDQGHRLEDVAAWLGHKRITTAQVYAQVRADRLRELSESLASPLLGLPDRKGA